MANVISVDWDFFTLNRELDSSVWDDEHRRNTHGGLIYDWQMKETASTVMENVIWEARAVNLMRNGMEPKHATRPMLSADEFAQEISLRFRDGLIGSALGLRADSHAWLAPLGRQLAEEFFHEPLTVWNFDAHHDLGYADLTYDNGQVDLECGNWAAIGLRDGWIKNFIQVYPDFRGRKEWHGIRRPWLRGLNKQIEITTWSNFLRTVEPREREIDATFLCRSSSWTPPWWDHEFETLSEEFGYHECLDCKHPEFQRYDTCKRRPFDWNSVNAHLERIAELERNELYLPRRDAA